MIKNYDDKQWESPANTLSDFYGLFVVMSENFSETIQLYGKSVCWGRIKWDERKEVHSFDMIFQKAFNKRNSHPFSSMFAIKY